MLGMIAAVAESGLIGCAGKIPWHYPLDLKFFKETTEGCAVIMGRRTWDSLPPKFRPLPNRQNLVVSRGVGSFHDAGWCSSLAEALHQVDVGKDAWIIGGGEIYRQALSAADRIVLTLVPDVIADPTEPVYFPFLSPRVWELRSHAPQHHPDKRLQIAEYRRHPCP